MSHQICWDESSDFESATPDSVNSVALPSRNSTPIFSTEPDPSSTVFGGTGHFYSSSFFLLFSTA